MRSPGRATASAWALCLLLLAPAAPAQEAGDDPSALVDALLTGLLGFREITPAELQDEVARVGGVPFRESVPLGYMTAAEFKTYLKGVLDDEYPPARARADERLLEALDLLPAGTDLRQTRTRLLEQNVAGFYDDRPGRKRLYSITGQNRLTPSNQLVMSHELRHALQDQHASINAVLGREIGDFDDRRFAFLSLLEGDATLVMERFLKTRVPELPDAGQDLGSLARAALPPMSDVPPVLREQLLLPYLAGHEFVRRLVERGGWEAVRQAWSKPPASTEQVLHPEKFAAGEAPLAVPGARGPVGASPVLDGVFGEVLVNTLLGDVPQAAAGWGGDRYQVWDVKGKTLVRWRSRWDTEKDRLEFVEALLNRFEASHGKRRTLLGASLFGKGRWNVAVVADPEGVTLFSSDDAGLLTSALRPAS